MRTLFPPRVILMYYLVIRDLMSVIPTFPQQEFVGSVLYLAAHLRPDMAHAVSVVAQDICH